MYKYASVTIINVLMCTKLGIRLRCFHLHIMKILLTSHKGPDTSRNLIQAE